MTTGETMSVLADAAFERFAPDWTDEPSSDDEEMKRAFFSELEKKHGGPISAEELRLWSNALDEDDTDAELAPVVEAAAGGGDRLRRGSPGRAGGPEWKAVVQQQSGFGLPPHVTASSHLPFLSWFSCSSHPGYRGLARPGAATMIL